MKQHIKTALIFAVIIIMVSGASVNAGISGWDDRADLYEVYGPTRMLADSVPSLWDSAQVTPDASGAYYLLKTRALKTAKNLCWFTNYGDQPSGSRCSASFVGRDLVLTAGHCIPDEEACGRTRFVFGYAINAAGSGAPKSIPARDVYDCKQIVARFGDLPDTNTGELAVGADFALIRVNRMITGHAPLTLNFTTRSKLDQSVFMIGYPQGLPLKIAGNARITDNSSYDFFEANLDEFGGNSGSPVFNADTQEVEGILVRTYKADYEEGLFGCNKLAYYPSRDSRGVHVNRLSTLKELIPFISGERE